MAQQLPQGPGSGREIGGNPRPDAIDQGRVGEPPTGRAQSGPSRPLVEASDWAGRAPFACQNGDRLLLLESKSPGWVLAELRFDAGGCRYVEMRRARYRWAREAAGALLSRALAEGDEAAERADRDLRDWLIAG